MADQAAEIVEYRVLEPALDENGAYQQYGYVTSQLWAETKAAQLRDRGVDPVVQFRVVGSGGEWQNVA